MYHWGDGEEGWGHHMWGDGPGDGSWMMSGGGGFMWLWWLLVLAAIGGVIYLAVRLASRSGKSDAVAPPAVPPTSGEPPRDAVSSAREILEDRLARGEIDATEFRERIKALTES